MARSVSLAAAAGVAYGAASVFTKSVAGPGDAWPTSARSLLAAVPVLVLIGLLAAAGLAASQAAYRGGGLAAPLATTTVVNPVFSAAVGIAMFGEGFRHGAAGALGALAAGTVTAWGLVVLAADSAGSATKQGGDGEAAAEGPRPVVIQAPGRRPGAGATEGAESSQNSPEPVPR